MTFDIGGFTPMTTTDFPGRLAAVVFCQGCPWRCGYCHNTHLQARETGPDASWPEILAFLDRRRGLLDGVVFSGGEPTLQQGLAGAMVEVRARGFEIGLHTAGIYPERLGPLLPALDWVGFDIKAPFSSYDSITGVPGSGKSAQRSLEALLASGCAYEVRTTLHSAQIGLSGVLALAADLHAYGVRHWALQEFRPQGCTDTALIHAHQRGWIATCAREVLTRFPDFALRQS